MRDIYRQQSSQPDDPMPALPPDPAKGDVVEAVADLLVQRGYQFVPDARLPEMRRALQPFLLGQ